MILTIMNQVKLGFTIDGGEKFKYVSEDENTVFFKDKDGNLVSIDIKVKGYSDNLMGDKFEIKYKDKTILVDNTKWMDEGTIITLSNGKEYRRIWTNVDFIKEDYTETPFDVKLVDGIYSTYSYTKGSSVYTLLLMTIPGIFYSLANIMYPGKLWRIGHIFTISGGEPTEWAISSSKIGGTILLMTILFAPPLFTLIQ